VLGERKMIIILKKEVQITNITGSVFCEKKDYYYLQLEEESPAVGKFGLGSRNENGNRLVQFAIENNLKIANIFFKKRKNRKWTWLSPDENIKNEIDHLLINDETIVKYVDCIVTFKFPSDHRPIRCIIKIPQRICYIYFIKSSKKKENIN
jgi:hypothetical protein